MAPKPGPRTLESPYAEPAWPTIGQEDEEAALELLYSLLEQIGQYRARYVTPSKGRRAKGKPQGGRAIVTGQPSGREEDGGERCKPPPPEVLGHVRVGFNSIVRCLDPAAKTVMDRNPHAHSPAGEEGVHEPVLAAVLADRSNVPGMALSQLPLLAAAAAAAGRGGATPVRLVSLPRGSAARISLALGVPRAGLVGIGSDCPGARPLLRFLEECVPPVEVSWIQKSLEPTYQQMVTGTQEKAPGHRDN